MVPCPPYKYAITFGAPPLAGISLGLAYSVFTVFAILSIPFVIRHIHETKGVELEDMAELEGTGKRT